MIRRLFRLLRYRPSRSTLLVLGIAQGWGQVKLWLTLLVAWTGWPAWVQWAAGTALAVVITVACFRTAEWAVRRWDGALAAPADTVVSAEKHQGKR